MSEEAKNVPEQAQGAFVEALLRNNKQIKADRAKAIIQNSEVIYRRKVEDLELQISNIIMKQEASIDLSPDNSMALMPNLKNHDPNQFADDDIKLAIDKKQLEIKLECAKNRYEHLFGPYKA